MGLEIKKHNNFNAVTSTSAQGSAKDSAISSQQSAVSIQESEFKQSDAGSLKPEIGNRSSLQRSANLFIPNLPHSISPSSLEGEGTRRGGEGEVSLQQAIAMGEAFYFITKDEQSLEILFQVYRQFGSDPDTLKARLETLQQQLASSPNRIGSLKLHIPSIEELKAPSENILSLEDQLQQMQANLLALVDEAHPDSPFDREVQHAMIHLFFGEEEKAIEALQKIRKSFHDKPMPLILSAEDLEKWITINHHIASLTVDDYALNRKVTEEAAQLIEQLKSLFVGAIHELPLQIENLQLHAARMIHDLDQKLAKGEISESKYLEDVRREHENVARELRLSFPGSAWERTVLEAPPPLQEGRAFEALRSQAEPGNENGALTPDPSPSGRGAIAGTSRAGSPLPEGEGSGVRAQSILATAILETRLTILEISLQEIPLNYPNASSEKLSALREKEFQRYFSEAENLSSQISPEALNELSSRARLMQAHETFKAGEIEATLIQVQEILQNYPNTSTVQKMRFEDSWLRTYGILDSAGKLATEVHHPSVIEGLKTGALQLGKKPGRALGACLVGGTASVGLGALTGGLGTLSGAVFLSGCSGAFALERGVTAASGSGEIDAAYETGVSLVTNKEAAIHAGLFAANLLSMYYGGMTGGLAQQATKTFGMQLAVPLTKGLIRYGMTPGPWARSVGNFALNEASYVANAVIFHKTSELLLSPLTGNSKNQNEAEAYLHSWLFVRLLPVVYQMNPGAAITLGKNLSDRIVRSGINTVAAAASVQAAQALARRDFDGFMDQVAKLSVELKVLHEGNQVIAKTAFGVPKVVHQVMLNLHLQELLSRGEVDQRIKNAPPPDGGFSGGLQPVAAGLGTRGPGSFAFKPDVEKGPSVYLSEMEGEDKGTEKSSEEILNEILNKHPQAAEAVKVMDEAGWNKKLCTNLLVHLAQLAGDNGEKVEVVYAKLPAVLELMKDTGWNSEPQYQFLLELAEKVGRGVGFAYEKLPKALAGMKDMGWSFEQQSQLLLRLAKVSDRYVGSAYENLTKAIAGLKDTGWSPEQQYQFLLRLAEKAKFSVDDGYAGLPKALEALKDTGLGFEQQSQFLLQLAKKVRCNLWNIYDELPAVFEGLKDTGSSFEQQSQLLLQLVEETGSQAGSVYVDLPKVLAGMKDTGWSFEQQSQLLLLLAPKQIGQSWSAYENLPKVLAGMKDAGWSFEQQSQLLRQLALMTDQYVWSAYENLTKAIAGMKDTGWSSEQQYQLLLQLVDKVGGQVGSAYENLTKAIAGMKDTGWSSEQQYQLLLQLVDKVGGQVGSAYENLPKAIAGMKDTGWSSEQQYQFLLQLAKKKGWLNVGTVHENLPKALAGMKDMGWSPEHQYQILLQLAEKANQDYWLVLSCFGESLLFSVPEQRDPVKNLFLKLLDHLTDYNRGRALSLIEDHSELFKALGPENFPEHFKLYVDIFERWPRLGFGILEGLLEATKAGIVPHDLNSPSPRPSPAGGEGVNSREKILHFIEQTNGFIPDFYKAYLKEGEALFPKLRVHVEAILKDQFSLEDTKRLMAEHGEEFLLGIIQMTSPTSGASFVKKSEQLGLLKKMLKAGDLRGHIPEKWRGKLESFAMRMGAWRLKEGELADSEGKIRDLLGGFRVSEGAPKVGEKELVEVLEEYLRAKRGGPSPLAPLPRGEGNEWEKVRKTLYQFAGQNDALREKIDRIQDYDYTTLLLLEQLFGDKDNLQKILAEALEKIPEELLSVQGSKRRIVGDGNPIVKSLQKVWSGDVGGKQIGEEKKLEILGSILKAYETADIEAKILSRVDLSEDLKTAIREVMHQAPALGKKQIIAEILAEPMELIQKEKAKYAYQDQGELKVGLRAVKGPAYGLSGLSSGVCTATDIELWKNPNFKLFAIIDENKAQAVGYIHVFETTIDGKKYLTLPGINPSAEFLGIVDAKKLYEGLMEKVIEFAKAGNFAGVYIPTNATIHSNRSDIQKSIQRAPYPVKKIPQVKWNTLPNPYPFEEVYGVWEGNSK